MVRDDIGFNDIDFRDIDDIVITDEDIVDIDYILHIDDNIVKEINKYYFDLTDDKYKFIGFLVKEGIFIDYMRGLGWKYDRLCHMIISYKDYPDKYLIRSFFWTNFNKWNSINIRWTKWIDNMEYNKYNYYIG
jgi:hypothetical protein